MTLPLPFPTPRALLSSLVVVAFGTRVHAICDGSLGKRPVVLPAELYPPRQDPCPGCGHRTRPECATIAGCPTAEGWAAAGRGYSSAAEVTP